MNIIEAVKNLAAKEREVRKLEMLIEHVASLKEDELAKVLSALAAARSVHNAALRLGSASMPHEAPQETPQQPLSTRAHPATVLNDSQTKSGRCTTHAFDAVV